MENEPLFNRTSAWMPSAYCRGLPPEMFFPSSAEGVEAAKQYCGACAVKELCLEYALFNHIEHGIWGGTSERERRRISQNKSLPINKP